MNVLIVDDEPTTRHLLHRILHGQFGVAVDHAPNGQAALEQLARERYDLMMLDLQMPVMTGVETLEAVRQSPAHGDLPIIVLTGEAEEQLVRQVLALGISDYLVKPLRPQSIIDRVGRVLNASRHVEAPATRPRLLRPNDSVLLADESAFRSSYARLLAERFNVREAESAADVERFCLQQPPAAVFIGWLSGPMPAAALAARLRQVPRLDKTRLIAVVSQAELHQARAVGDFHDVIVRSSIADRFRRELDGLLERSADDVALERLRGAMATVAEQVCGLMLRVDVRATPAIPFEPPEEALTMSGSFLDPEGQRELALVIEASRSFGRTAAKCRGVQGPDVHEAAPDAVAELLSIVVSKVEDRLGTMSRNPRRHAIKPVDRDIRREWPLDSTRLSVDFHMAGGFAFRLTLLQKNREPVASHRPTTSGGAQPAPPGANGHGHAGRADETPAVDRSVLEALREIQTPGEPDIVLEVTQLFLEDAPGRLAALRQAADARDQEALRQVAHALAASCGNVGALRMQAICRAIEQAVRDAEVHQAVQLADRLPQEFDSVRPALQALGERAM